MKNFYGRNGAYNRVGEHLCEKWPVILGIPLAMLWALATGLLFRAFLPRRYWND